MPQEREREFFFIDYPRDFVPKGRASASIMGDRKNTFGEAKKTFFRIIIIEEEDRQLYLIALSLLCSSPWAQVGSQSDRGGGAAS